MGFISFDRICEVIINIEPIIVILTFIVTIIGLIIALKSYKMNKRELRDKKSETYEKNRPKITLKECVFCPTDKVKLYMGNDLDTINPFRYDVLDEFPNIIFNRPESMQTISLNHVIINFCYKNTTNLIIKRDGIFIHNALNIVLDFDKNYQIKSFIVKDIYFDLYNFHSCKEVKIDLAFDIKGLSTLEIPVSYFSLDTRKDIFNLDSMLKLITEELQVDIIKSKDESRKYILFKTAGFLIQCQTDKNDYYYSIILKKSYEEDKFVTFVHYEIEPFYKLKNFKSKIFE